MPLASGSDDPVTRVFDEFRLAEYSSHAYVSTQEPAPDPGTYHFPLGGSSLPLPSPTPPKR